MINERILYLVSRKKKRTIVGIKDSIVNQDRQIRDTNNEILS